MAAGVSFGFVRGLTAAAIGSVAGAALQFVLARHLLKPAVDRLVASTPGLSAIQAAVLRQEFRLQALVGPAARAGLLRGDVIRSVDGQPVADSNALRNHIAQARPGASVTLDVIREGRNETVHATLGQLEPTRTRAAASSDEPGSPTFGMTLEPLTPDVARDLNLSAAKAGVVIRGVDPEGAAADAGLQAGDVISRVNGQAVKTPADVKTALNAAGDRPALLLITRDGADLFLALRHPRS